MAVRRSRFPAPLSLPATRRQTEQHVFAPDDGLRRNVLPQHLPPTAAWVFENLEGDAGGFMPRSGFSRHVATVSSAYSYNWLLATHFYSPSRTGSGTTSGPPDMNIGVLISSARTPQYFDFFDPTVTNSVWSSARDNSLGIGPFQVGSVGTRYWNAAVGGDFGTNLVQVLLASNGSEIITVRSNRSSNNVVYALFTNYATGIFDNVSNNSGPMYRPLFPASLDERNVWFSELSRPYTVQWSKRGDPDQYAGGDSGFQELIMSGKPTGMKVESNALVLFTDTQVWTGVPRRDLFGFDFNRVEADVGAPYSRTIVDTPHGLCFLGADLQLHLVRQGQVRSFASYLPALLSAATLRDTDAPFAAYDSENDSYVLFYSEDTASVSTPGATHAMTVPMGQGRSVAVWRAPGTLRWQNVMRPIALSDSTVRYPLTVCASDGSVYRKLSTTTLDDTSVVTGVYRTPALNTGLTFSMPTDAWIEANGIAPALLELRYSTTMFSDGSVSVGTRSVSALSLDSGTTAVHLPMSVAAARHPQFELRVSGGARIGHLALQLRNYLGKHLG